MGQALASRQHLQRAIERTSRIKLNLINNPKPETDCSRNQEVGQAFLLYCICLGLMLTLGVGSQMVSLYWGLMFTLLVVILLPAIIFVRIKRIGIFSGLRLNPVSPLLILIGFFVGVGGWSAAIGIHQIVALALGPPLSPELDISSHWAYLGMLLVFAVMPAICEECLFRGAIQGVLERRGRWFSIVITGGLFGLFHMDPWNILPAAFLGCVFGWLTVRTQSILPAITAHFANNSTAFTTGYVLQGETEMPTWLLPTLGVLFVISVFAFIKKTGAPTDRAVPNPLSLVPAKVHIVVGWLSGIFISLFAAAMAAFACLFVFVVAVVEMNDDGLLPHIKKGDSLILIKNGSLAFDIKQGDTISFARDGKTVSRVVSQIDGDRVDVLDEGDHVVIALNDVIGKMVQIIPQPQENEPNTSSSVPETKSE